jgi:DNA-binding transcriptional MocR family regulator
MTAQSSSNPAQLVQHQPVGQVARLLRPRLVGEGPLRERLAGAIREAAAVGELAAGGRLPPERELAAALGISRGTVVAAYRALAAAGAVDRRQGSGTWLRGPDEARSIPSRGHYLYQAGPAPAQARATIDLSVAGPPPPDDLAEALARLDPAELAELGHGYDLLGIPPLRRAIARHLGRWGLAAADDEILVTAGAQQAIAMIAALRVRPGDPVLVEDPSYVGALDAIAAAGGRAVSVALDEAGMRPDALREAAGETGAKLAFIVPTGQNPTGTVMPERRRAEIGGVLAECGVVGVEDCTLHDLALRAARPRTLAELAPRAQIVVVGSLSKLVWGGLRMGWIRGPAELMDRLGRLKLALDHGSPGVSQLVGARLLEDGEARRERVRADIAARIRAVDAALSDRLPAWRWRSPEGGLSLWVRLPGPEATGFARLARAMGVAVVPGPLVSAARGFDDHLRLALVHEPEVMREAVERLAEAWRVYVPGPGASRHALAGVV